MKSQRMNAQALLAMCLVLPTVSFASDAILGETVYRSRCQNCHEASFGDALRPGSTALRARTGAPDFGTLAKTRTAEQLRTWIHFPWKVKKDTSCGARDLSEAQQRDLVTFILSRAKPPPPPEIVRLRKQYEAAIAAQNPGLPSGGPVTPSGGSDKKGRGR